MSPSLHELLSRPVPAKLQQYPTKVHALVNQKGGVGKTTLAMNLAAVTYEAHTRTLPGRPVDGPCPVLVVSTDPQASSVWWSDRVNEVGAGLPFDYAQTTDPDELSLLRGSQYRHVFVDTPGSLVDRTILERALDYATDVIVPMLVEVLCFDPTRRTIESVLSPRGVPFNVVVNNWETRDGQLDLKQTVEYIVAMGWPFCNNPVRRYKLHARAAAEGAVCTQYGRSRAAVEAKNDFLQLALELGYGAQKGMPA